MAANASALRGREEVSIAPDCEVGEVRVAEEVVIRADGDVTVCDTIVDRTVGAWEVCTSTVTVVTTPGSEVIVIASVDTQVGWMVSVRTEERVTIPGANSVGAITRPRVKSEASAEEAIGEAFNISSKPGGRHQHRNADQVRAALQGAARSEGVEIFRSRDLPAGTKRA